MTIRNVCLIGCLCVAVYCPVWAGGSFGGEITPAEMQAHIDFLASDQLAGRDAGQPGAELAARFIASEFARLELAKLGGSWEMEFDLPGGAGTGDAEIAIGDTRLAGASLLGVPRCSGAGEIEAPLVLESAEDVAGSIVLVDTPVGRRELRDKAREFLDRGARGVIFLQTSLWLEPARRGSMMAWDEGEGPMAMMNGDDGEAASLSELPPGILEQVQETLKNMGINGEDGQFKVMYQTVPDQEASDGESAAPSSQPSFEMFSGIPGEVSISGGGSLWNSAPRLDGIVVQACGTIGGLLHAAVEKERSVMLRVTYSGRDQSSNVLALVEGSDPVLKDEYVVIGGHYDHIGVTRSGRVCNGADDNASGVAGVLEIAEALAAMPVKPKRSIIMAAWGAEERGLVGSRAFIENCPVPTDKIVGYVNLDMISRNDSDEIELGATGEILTQWAREAAAENGLTTDRMGFLMRMSDTSSFMSREIPTAFFCSGMFDGLHSPNDDADLIDADKAARVARTALRLACRLADNDERLEYASPARGGRFGGDGPRRGGPGREGRRLLGIYLDYNQGEAVVVDRVRRNSVAESAGIQPKDRIVRIGGQETKTREQIAAALKDIPDETPFEIEVNRKNENGEETNVVLHAIFPAKKE